MLRRRVFPRSAAIAAVLLLAACGRTTGPSTGDRAALHIVNVDGPRVVVLLADANVATVECGGEATLVPGDNVPQPPWSLAVRADDGAILRSVSIVGDLPQGMLIRGRAVLTGPWPMSYGPAPSPLDALCEGTTRNGE